MKSNLKESRKKKLKKRRKKNLNEKKRRNIDKKKVQDVSRFNTPCNIYPWGNIPSINKTPHEE